MPSQWLIHYTGVMAQTDFNLNADMGESFGAWRMGDDNALLSIIDSANIACGFHAGDYNIMATTMASAVKHGVSIGAHPSFYDLHGFGRRPLALPAGEIENLIAYQLGASLGAAALLGADVSVTHVKPHGALNNMACADADIATAIAKAVKAVDSSQILLAPVLSALAEAGRKHGLKVAEEVFADRGYAADGQLLKRGLPGSMIHDAETASKRAVAMFTDQQIISHGGKRLAITPHSICVHGDGAEAVAIAKAVKNALLTAGLTAKPLPDLRL